MNVYYIKSLKWTNHKETNPTGEYIWWGPNNSGYTKDITEAGIYTEEQVKRHREYNHPHISEIVPINAEAWDERKINSHKLFLASEKNQLKEWERKLEEAKQMAKVAEQTIQSYENSIKKLNMELNIQEKLQIKA